MWHQLLICYKAIKAGSLSFELTRVYNRKVKRITKMSTPSKLYTVLEWKYFCLELLMDDEGEKYFV